MPAKLSPEQLEKALELRRKCWTHERIASEIGVCRKTVVRHLSAHHRRVLSRFERQAAAIKAQQIAQLEWTAEEAAAAWLKSKEAAETLKTVTGETPKGPIDTTETTIKGQVGDPRMLQGVLAALAEVRSILGLDASAALARAKFDLTAKPPGQAEARDAWEVIAGEIDAQPHG